MSEMENFDMEQASTEALNEINFDSNGVGMIEGAVAGGTVTGVVTWKLGYAAGVKDAAHAKKMDPKDMLKEIKKMKGEKKKKGITMFGYKLQSPFKKVEGSNEPQEVTVKKAEEENDSKANE